jgi:hypothetical protein
MRRIVHHEVGEPMICAKIVHRNEAGGAHAHTNRARRIVREELCAAAEHVHVREIPSRPRILHVQHGLDCVWGEEDERADERFEQHLLLDDREQSTDRRCDLLAREPFAAKLCERLGYGHRHALGSNPDLADQSPAQIRSAALATIQHALSRPGFEQDVVLARAKIVRNLTSW